MSEELFNTEDLNEPQDPVIESEIEEKESENIEDTEDQENDELNGEDMEGIEENDTEATENTEETPTESAAPAKKKPTQDRITNLPIAKIKHIIKLDPDVNLVNSDAVLVITKATEMFIKSLAKEAFQFAAQNKKKTLAKNHVDSALTMLPIEL